MARSNRTKQAPYLPMFAHGWRGFTWELTLSISPSGYVGAVSAVACHEVGDDRSYGTAWTLVEFDDDVSTAIEACVVEAAAIATEPSLFAAVPAVKRLSHDEVFGR